MPCLLYCSREYSPLFDTSYAVVTEALGYKLTKTTDIANNKTSSSKTRVNNKADSTVNMSDFVRQKTENPPPLFAELTISYKNEAAKDDQTDEQRNISVKKGGKNSLQMETFAGIRAKRRVSSNVNLFERFITRLYNNQFLAPTIIVTGGLINYLYALDNVGSAMITIATASIAALIFAFRHDPIIQNQEEKKATELRFEKLEDKAWELSESEERYRSIAEAFDDLLVMRDQDGKILFCNPAFSTSFGKTVEQITHTDFAPIPIHLSKSKEENGAKIGQGLGLETKEIAFETSEGLKWFSWLDLPVRGDDNNGAVVLSIARDITSYKFAEQSLEVARGKAEQANRAKSRFLAMVSHEMRTPLNGVLGMSKLLKGTSITDEQNTYIDSIYSSGSSLLYLIEEMLDITMIEAGRFKLQEQDTDIRQLMSDVVELMSARAYSKNIGLGFFVDTNVPKIIHTDPARLKQIIFNLLGNAIKFTQSGGVALQCCVNNIDTLNNTANVIFNVIDTGPGLNVADQKRIFQEFERIDDENTRNVDGAGLGLTISKAIADQLGGELALAKSGDHGSTFTLDLTLNFVPETQDKSISRKPLKGKSILLGMRNLMEADCLQKQIEANGGKVDRFTNLDDIKRVLEGKFDYNTVILDTQSFELQAGKSASSEIAKYLKLWSSKNNLHIIVLIDPADRKNLLHLLDKGADAYLIRPVREVSLLNVLSGNFVKKSSLDDYEDQLQGASTNQVFEQQLRGKTVLLAEDNDINKMLVTACLTKAGAKVVHAANGKLAVDLFSADKFDVVLMDMHMPILDGISATQKIREFEKSNGIKKPTKIIALTADDQEISRKNAFSAGMDDFLQKPIDPNVLVKIVKVYTAD